MKEKWEMTFPQYCQDYLESCRYRAAYEANPQKWENKKQYLLNDWVNVLKERAKVGPIPSPVIMSYIRQFGERALFSVFRGVYEPGISHFRIPATVRR